MAQVPNRMRLKSLPRLVRTKSLDERMVPASTTRPCRENETNCRALLLSQQ
jgi:hypothetical protein